MDLKCEKVTSTSVLIVKCMEKYGDKYLIRFVLMMPK